MLSRRGVVTSKCSDHEYEDSRVPVPRDGLPRLDSNYIAIRWIDVMEIG